jgi:hypothetical protein
MAKITPLQLVNSPSGVLLLLLLLSHCVSSPAPTLALASASLLHGNKTVDRFLFAAAAAVFPHCCAFFFAPATDTACQQQKEKATLINMTSLQQEFAR